MAQPDISNEEEFEDVFSWLLGGMENPSNDPILEQGAPQPSIDGNQVNNVATDRFNWADNLFGDLSSEGSVSEAVKTPGNGADPILDTYPSFLENETVISGATVSAEAIEQPKPKPKTRMTQPRHTQTATTRASVSQTTRKRKGAPRPLSPKSLAQREKNREAVRNCRKRKKEHTQILREKAVLFEEENARLRFQLQLGSEEMQRLKNVEGEELVREMDAMLQRFASGSKSDSATHAQQLNSKYLDRLLDHGKDRQAALSYIVSRLKRLLQPARPTKMYLWQIAQDDTFFKQQGGLWQAMCKELGLTPEQQASLRKRRENVTRLRSDIAASIDKLNDVNIALSSYNSANDGKIFRNLSKIFTPVQVSKFISWVHKENSSAHQDVVKETWNSMMLALDTELDKQARNRVSNGSIFDPNTMNSDQNGAKILLEKQPQLTLVQQPEELGHKKLQFDRNRVVQDTRLIFLIPEEQMFALAEKIFTKNCVLFDPNNGGEFVGLEMVLRYIRRIRLAFSYHSREEDRLMAQQMRTYVKDDKGRGSWMLTGTYNGKLAKKHTSSPSNAISTSQKDMEHGQRVSFKVIIAFKFENKSSRIEEMVVSWDAMSLMRQLRLLPPEVNVSVMKRKVQPPPQRTMTKITAKQAEEMCKTLAKLFECNAPEESKTIADSVLDEKCFFHDSNMGGKFRGIQQCLKYIRRLRGPFPKFKVKSMNISSISNQNTPNPRLQMGWAVEALYGGALVASNKSCNFNAVLFVGLSSYSRKIQEVQMSWNATTLMQQLGVIAAKP